jgi:hypothetical protein
VKIKLAQKEKRMAMGMYENMVSRNAKVAGPVRADSFDMKTRMMATPTGTVQQERNDANVDYENSNMTQNSMSMQIKRQYASMKYNSK